MNTYFAFYFIEERKGGKVMNQAFEMGEGMR